MQTLSLFYITNRFSKWKESEVQKNATDFFIFNKTDNISRYSLVIPMKIKLNLRLLMIAPIKIPLPMTNDSSAKSLSPDTKTTVMKSPKFSTVNFLRQFARAYTNVNTMTFGNFIAN